MFVVFEGEGGESVDGLLRGGVVKYCVFLCVVIFVMNGKFFVVFVSCFEGYVFKGVVEVEDVVWDNVFMVMKFMNSKDKDDDDDFFGMFKKFVGGGKCGGMILNKMFDGFLWFW